MIDRIERSRSPECAGKPVGLDPDHGLQHESGDEARRSPVIAGILERHDIGNDIALPPGIGEDVELSHG
jgi:hypothetical protein